ncbi:thiamine pyrophosphate-binding protein [Paenibacillus sp. 1P07SE]|uniref:thiamine pyrophosphate-binding protein n=1 Tax=Paenibacillus sp. 1P07SE TaxID=3132209 RepID=UPI0039A4AE05
MTTWSRDLLFQLLRHYDVPFVFGNPGTSELPFIDGVPKHEGFEYITALHEANAVGMAMGYARQSGKPAVVILHVAPGLANGMGNIYNAYRAGIPLIVIAGQHHTRLLLDEPILAGDHVGQVRSMTKWAHEVRHAEEWPQALVRAFKVAMTPPHGPVFLSVPYDISMAEAAVDTLPKPLQVSSRFAADPAALRAIAERLLTAGRPLIIAGDGVGDAHANLALQRLAELTGIGVLSEGMPTRQSFDNRHPHYLGTLPMNGPAIRRTYSSYDTIFFVGVSVQAPLALYDGGGSLVGPDTTVLYLHDDPWEIGKNHVAGIGAWGDIRVSLEALAAEIAGGVAAQSADVAGEREAGPADGEADRLSGLSGLAGGSETKNNDTASGGAASGREQTKGQEPGIPRESEISDVKRSASAAALQTRIAERTAAVQLQSQSRREQLAAVREGDRSKGVLTPALIAEALDRALPDDGRFVIVNEAVSNALPFTDHITMWEPNHYTAGKGGGLGHGTSQAVGAALAEPDRAVVSVVGDGTFLYYPQILYSAVVTKARVLFLVVNNRAYHVLKTGLQAMGSPLGGAHLPSLDLDGPADLVQMSQSFGVSAERVASLADLDAAIRRGLDAKGPYLLDVHVTN